MALKKINSALISVFDKEGLQPLVSKLKSLNINIISTGGTQNYLEQLGVDVISVESITDYPSILGGRVKTLHPKIFGGILARRNESGDLAQLEEYDIEQIDLVIVDLYPFEETVKSGASEKDIIEKIDIGGISLIRAAAKNYNDTLVVSSKKQYEVLLQLLNENNGQTDLNTRKQFAAAAFAISSHYDTAIFNYLKNDDDHSFFKQSRMESKPLRYGENPHQTARFYGLMDEMFDQLNGKEISYNNLVDIDAAINLIDEFDDTAFIIIKHTNACGIALAADVKQAYEKALACDNISAFGGILATNRKVDLAAATEINKLFFEVLLAPAFDGEALDLLKQKKNRIILELKNFKKPNRKFRSLLNGLVEQDEDMLTEKQAVFENVTKTIANQTELDDLEVAIIAAKHLKSNTIALVKNKQLIGMGCGQTSRVDALKQAILKAEQFGFSLNGAVMASDAFFPFPDCVEIAHLAGITAVAQPGGSIKDQDSIDYCNANNLAMVFTGNRHFKH